MCTECGGPEIRMFRLYKPAFYMYHVCPCVVIFVCFRSDVYISKGKTHKVSGAGVAQWVRSLDLTTHTSLSSIRRGFVPGFVNYKKGCTRLASASDKVYQLLAHGRWFSPGTLASSTTKTDRHYIAEILMKVALNTIILNLYFCYL